jgi:hypothetical protein
MMAYSPAGGYQHFRGITYYSTWCHRLEDHNWCHNTIYTFRSVTGIVLCISSLSECSININSFNKLSTLNPRFLSQQSGTKNKNQQHLLLQAVCSQNWNVYSTEYTDILRAFFMPHHIGPCPLTWNTVICILGHFCTKVIVMQQCLLTMALDCLSCNFIPLLHKIKNPWILLCNNGNNGCEKYLPTMT